MDISLLSTEASVRYSSIQRRIFDTAPLTLTTGTGITLDARGCSALTVLPDAAATVTITRVDTVDASEHSTDGSAAVDDVLPDTLMTMTVDWPFYHITTAGGSCRLAILG